MFFHVSYPSVGRGGKEATREMACYICLKSETLRPPQIGSLRTWKPNKLPADQERIREGRLSPHVIDGFISKDVPLLRRYINGSSVATTVHPEDNILRMLRLDGGSSAAKDLCENAG